MSETNREFIDLAQARNTLLQLEAIEGFLAGLDELAPYADYDTISSPYYQLDLTPADSLPDADRLTVSYEEGSEGNTDIHRPGRLEIFVGSKNGWTESETTITVGTDGELMADGPDGLDENGVLELTTSRLATLMDAVRRAHQVKLAEAQEWQQAREKLHPTFDRLVDDGRLESVKGITAASLLDRPAQAATVAALEQAGIHIDHRQQVGEHTTVYFSQAVIGAGGGRPSVVGLVEQAGRPVEPQLFYLSQSRGAWRWLPGYDWQEHWYEKGDDDQGPQAMTLPRVLQKSLHHILARDGYNITDDNGEVLEDLLMTVVPAIDRTRMETRPAAAFYFLRETADPSALAEMPDYSHRIDGWEFQSPLYGQTYVDVFLSHDGRREFAMAHDRAGRAWPVYGAAVSAGNIIRTQGLGPDTSPFRLSVRGGSPEMRTFGAVLGGLQFEAHSSQPEKYDKTVMHERRRSTLYPDVELIISWHDGDILDCSARQLAPPSDEEG